MREFAQRAFAEVGVTLRFEGEGTDEVGVVDAVDLVRLSAARSGRDPDEGPVPADGEGAVLPGAVVLRVDPRYHRPTEVASLIGDPGKARERLGWQATVHFDELVADMVRCDLLDARSDELLRTCGFTVRNYKE